MKSFVRAVGSGRLSNQATWTETGEIIDVNSRSYKFKTVKMITINTISIVNIDKYTILIF
jgi:hypothetical protein